jgi:hypothetical protein
LRISKFLIIRRKSSHNNKKTQASASEQATSNKTQTQQRAQRLTFVFDIIPNNLHQNGTE